MSDPVEVAALAIAKSRGLAYEHDEGLLRLRPHLQQEARSDARAALEAVGYLEVCECLKWLVDVFDGTGREGRVTAEEMTAAVKAGREALSRAGGR